MNYENSQTLISANRSSLEALKDLGEIYLSGAERLTALNLASARGVFEDTVTASLQHASKKSESGFNLPQIAFAPPNFEKAVAYSRSAYEIILESQQEAVKKVSSLFANMNANFKFPVDLNASMEMFTNGVQEASSIVKKNVAIATDAAQRSVSETRAKLEKSA
jgi:phasin family protein